MLFHKIQGAGGLEQPPIEFSITDTELASSFTASLGDADPTRIIIATYTKSGTNSGLLSNWTLGGTPMTEIIDTYDNSDWEPTIGGAFLAFPTGVTASFSVTGPSASNRGSVIGRLLNATTLVGFARSALLDDTSPHTLSLSWEPGDLVFVSAMCRFSSGAAGDLTSDVAFSNSHDLGTGGGQLRSRWMIATGSGSSVTLSSNRAMVCYGFVYR